MKWTCVVPYKANVIAAILSMIVVLIVLPGSAPAQWLDGGARGPLVVILVRHADTADMPADDPGLTLAGSKRARDLAAALHDAAVTAIITTQFRRTRDTAEPLANQLRLTPQVVPVQSTLDEHARALREAVRRQMPGVALVIGHSNTIPPLIAALGGPQMSDICDAVYDNLFTMYDLGGKPGLLRTKYGDPTPDTAPECR
jgi:phosphohistidine phosphatase SixA